MAADMMQQTFMQMERPPVELGKLVHDSAQNAYKDLHALLDSLPDRSSLEKKEMILDYAQRTRHRMLRILVVVRWAMEYAVTLEKSNQATVLANRRSDAYSGAADALFFVRDASAAASSQEKLVAAAAEVLVGGELSNVPRAITRCIGLPEELSGGEREAEARLGELTRSVLRQCLPLEGNLCVLKWRSNEHSFASRIGVPGAWSADMTLDRLDAEQGVLLVLSTKIMVKGAGDREAGAESDGRGRFGMTDKQERILMGVCNDRVKRSLVGRGNGGLKGDEKPRIRFRRMIEAIRDFLGPEVCAPLAMFHLYKQAARLSQGLFGDIFKTDQLKVDKPLVVHYWRHHRKAAQVIISSSTVLEDAHAAGVASAGLRFMSIDHIPAIDGTVTRTVKPLTMNSLSLESLMWSSIRARCLSRLSFLYDKLSENTAVKAAVRLIRGDTVLIRIEPSNTAGGIELRIDVRTGNLRGRFFGAISSLGDRTFTEVQRGELKGLSRNFGSDDDEAAAVVRTVARVLHALSVLDLTQHFRRMGVGAFNGSPPGVVPPRTVPPYVPIEPKRPRSFATLDPGEDAPSVRNMELTRVGHLEFTRCSLSEVKNLSTARNWLQRERCDLSMARLRSIFVSLGVLKNSSAPWIPVPHKIGMYTNLGLQVTDWFAKQAALMVQENGSWQVKLMTVNESFDSQRGARAMAMRQGNQQRDVYYSDHILTFAYSTIDRDSVKTFSGELRRANILATLGSRLWKKTEFYIMTMRTPKRLHFGIPYSPAALAANAAASASSADRPQNGRVHPPVRKLSHRVAVELSTTWKFRVTIEPKIPQLQELMEEALEAARNEVDVMLAGMLERSCPFGAMIERTLLAYLKGRLYWRSLVYMRVTFAGVGPMARKSFWLEVDLRNWPWVIIKDEGGSEEVRTRDQPISALPEPCWKGVIDKLTQASERSIKRDPDHPHKVAIEAQAFEEFLRYILAGFKAAVQPPQAAQQFPQQMPPQQMPPQQMPQQQMPPQQMPQQQMSQQPMSQQQMSQQQMSQQQMPPPQIPQQQMSQQHVPQQQIPQQMPQQMPQQIPQQMTQQMPQQMRHKQ